MTIEDATVVCGDCPDHLGQRKGWCVSILREGEHYQYWVAENGEFHSLSTAAWPNGYYIQQQTDADPVHQRIAMEAIRQYKALPRPS
jgi:hypothetical protein